MADKKRVNVIVRWKEISVEEHEALVSVPVDQVDEYKAAGHGLALFEDDDLAAILHAGKISGPTFIRLHPVHYSKLLQSPYAGLFDFRVTKTRKTAKEWGVPPDKI